MLELSAETSPRSVTVLSRLTTAGRVVVTRPKETGPCAAALKRERARNRTTRRGRFMAGMIGKKAVRGEEFRVRQERETIRDSLPSSPYVGRVHGQIRHW